jgi:hypothetical protein
MIEFEDALKRRYDRALDVIYELIKAQPELGQELCLVSAALAEHRGRYEAYRDSQSNPEVGKI